MWNWNSRMRVYTLSQLNEHSKNQPMKPSHIYIRKAFTYSYSRGSLLLCDNWRIDLMSIYVAEWMNESINQFDVSVGLCQLHTNSFVHSWCWPKHPAISCYWLIDSATYMLIKINSPVFTFPLHLWWPIHMLLPPFYFFASISCGSISIKVATQSLKCLEYYKSVDRLCREVTSIGTYSLQPSPESITLLSGICHIVYITGESVAFPVTWHTCDNRS